MGDKWTPTTLAKKIGVSRQTVHNWLDGTSKPKGDHLNKLCKIMGTDPASLLYGESANLPDKGLVETAIISLETKLAELGVSLPTSERAAIIAALIRATAKSGTPPDSSIVSEMITLMTGKKAKE